MENTPRLYDTLVHILRQHEKWFDRRPLKTLAWMMVGLRGCLKSLHWLTELGYR
jgi:hypothetical protein